MEKTMSQLIMNALVAEANAKEAKAIANLNTYPTNHIDISYQMICMKFNGDGTALTWWYQYQNMEWWDLSTAYDLSTATFSNSKSSSPNNLLPSPYDNFLSFDYNGDGTKMITFSFGTGNHPSEGQVV